MYDPQQLYGRYAGNGNGTQQQQTKTTQQASSKKASKA